MNFFQELISITGEVDVTLRLKSKNGKITVGVLPAVSSTLPMIDVTGTPEELDHGFMDTVRAPLAQTAGLVSNVQEFTEQTKKATDAAKNPVPKDAAKPGKKSKPPADKKRDKSSVKQLTDSEKSDKQIDEELTAESTAEAESNDTDSTIQEAEDDATTDGTVEEDDSETIDEDGDPDTSDDSDTQETGEGGASGPVPQELF